MRKKIFLLLSFIIFFFIFLKSSFIIFAQESRMAGMSWHCLDAIPCNDPNANCAGSTSGHRAKLTTKPDDLPARNKQTYVFVCIATEQGNICTTGNSQVDYSTVGYDGVAKLKQSTTTGGFQFEGLFRSDGTTTVPADKIMSDSRGKLTVGGQVVEPLYWQDATPKGVGRKWLALNLIGPIQTEVGTGAQQQGTFIFEGALRKCVEIHWDPYGIVFDSQSLEPVSGVSVKLMKKRLNDQFTLVVPGDAVSILNPFTTEEDGSFSFFVPDGVYRINVSKPNFIFPNDSFKLNPDHSKIYSDIYRGEDIVQKGKIEHRDIPIDAIGTPYTAPVKLMSYFPLLDKGSNFLILQGRVSHPLTRINVYAKKQNGESSFDRSRVILSGVADKQGRFDLRIDLNNLNPNEFVGDLELIKSPLMGQQPQPQSNKGFLFRLLSKIKVINAQDSSTFFSIEPIFNHLEGYAYDNNGRPLPNTTVGVYLNFSNKSLYETKTDENGFFQIPSEYLPPMSYNIKYITSTGFSRLVTPSKFILENNQYLTEKKVNLYSFKNIKGQTLTPRPTISTPTSMWRGGGGGQVGGGDRVNITPTVDNRSQINILVVTGIILLILIITVAGIIYFYKKNQQKMPL